jgi:hypothetical protein
VPVPVKEMDRLWTVCRFIGSVARYYIIPTPSDFELTRAECGEVDITPELMSWMALQRPEDGKPWKDEKRLIVEYKYKGEGPYLVYFDKGDPFVFPPADVDLPKTLHHCIVSVEVERLDSDSKEDEEEPEDITARGTMLAGPNGRWDNRLMIETETETDRKLDIKLLCPDMKEGDSIIISLADGDEIRLP